MDTPSPQNVEHEIKHDMKCKSETRSCQFEKMQLFCSRSESGDFASHGLSERLLEDS